MKKYRAINEESKADYRILEHRENSWRSRFAANRHSSGFGWANHFDGPPRNDDFKAHSQQSRSYTTSHGRKGPKGFDNSRLFFPPSLSWERFFLTNQEITRYTFHILRMGTSFCIHIVIICNILYNTY